MLIGIKLINFKNFQDTTIILGPLTLLVGTNAAGKSNIRDACRFLHGISRGYSIAEILGEKYIEGGVLQWRGIRGGTKEITFAGRSSFELEVIFTIKDKTEERILAYWLQVETDRIGNPPRVIGESLTELIGINDRNQSQLIFDSHPKENPLPQHDPLYLNVRVHKKGSSQYPTFSFWNQCPIIGQIIEHNEVSQSVRETARLAIKAFTSMRFLDLTPDAMRMPSLPGQTILGDRGENLSSVLQAICQNPERKQALLQWIQKLTPMDAKDFEFPSDFTGKVLLTLVEENGQRISAYSASDGTLRFLGIIAALLGTEAARFYFIEELENGIHPTRLHLILQLIEQKVAEGRIQIIATTHSPQLLKSLSPKSLEYASLLYRIPNRTYAKVKRIIDIPEAQRIIQEQDLANLHESGWLEDMVYFC
jgi:predicted ATPase